MRGKTRKRLAVIALGWVVVAVSEAAAYIVLALSIVSGKGPGAVAVASLVALGVTVLVQRSGYLTGAKLAGDLFEKLGGALAETRLSWFTERNRSLVTGVASRVIPSMMSVPAHTLQTFIVAPLVPLLLVGGMAFVVRPSAALWVGVGLGVALCAQYVAQRSLARADQGRAACDEAVAVGATELLEHRELLRAMAGPERASERLRAAQRDQQQLLRRINRASALATGAASAATVAPLAAAMLTLVWGPGSSPAEALALVLLTMRAAAPLETLVTAGLSLRDLQNSLRQFREVTGAPVLPEAEQPRTPQSAELGISVRSHRGVLGPLDETIAAGERVVISGPTGSGKSTLLGLLMRFEDPDEGAITLGGVPLTELRYSELANRVAYVAQDPVIFSTSLADNIRLGDPLASDDDVLRVARLAALEGVLGRDPQGIHQRVGHRGSTLSGGEKQRVAIARALLKNAPVLVLDEATSALDAATEQRVVNALSKHPETTMLIVAHGDVQVWRPTRGIPLEFGREIAETATPLTNGGSASLGASRVQH
ncbi:ABC transporter ATP-binding protein [Leucobacter sp. UCMA 4100]|uniref:ATP-binding cassette domain-containing protein n=1 Tax=Leucobacter sp. UCMA 4100 TaxID=2810534 RepID=UPI0022EACC11|nr:ABC transporter ATP-binding protein [Leucobacter sp. UCMA 4100]MDA3148194.1 ABC transporter ATP-binding protein [Leucobacter sp. UCMA 4100]